jgi:ketosteroid isomerase-like protein
MKHVLFTATALLTLAIQGLAQANSVETLVRKLAQQQREAAIRGDASFEEKYLLPDYVGISPAGAITTREQSAARLKSGDVKLEKIDVSDERVRVYGNTAIIAGLVQVKGSFKGQAFEQTSSYTRVWIKQKGEWKLASFQETPIK